MDIVRVKITIVNNFLLQRRLPYVPTSGISKLKFISMKYIKSFFPCSLYFAKREIQKGYIRYWRRPKLVNCSVNVDTYQTHR